MVGVSTAASGLRAFLWTPTTVNGTTGSMINLGELTGGTDQSRAWGISASGKVVGSSESTTGTRAFLWTPTTPNGSTGTMINLGDLAGGTDKSEAFAVNTSGQVIGTSYNTVGPRAFLWTAADQMLDLNSLVDATGAGWTLEEARGINDFGQIVGGGRFDPDGPGGIAAVFHAVLLTPIPEPTLFWLAATTGAALLRSARPKR